MQEAVQVEITDQKNRDCGVNQPRLMPGMMRRKRADDTDVITQKTQKRMRSTAAAT